MSGEGKEDVEEIQPIKPDAEGKIAAGEDGKYPEVVPHSKYVGVKEAWGKAKARAEAAETKVQDLEEKLSKATSAEDVKKLQDELDGTKTKLEEANANLTNIQNKSLSEKRETLTKRGLSEEKVKDMSDKELDAALLALEQIKPNPDMGTGASGTVPTGSPLDLATQAYGEK